MACKSRWCSCSCPLHCALIIFPPQHSKLNAWEKWTWKKPKQYSSEFVVFLIRKLRLSSRILCQQVNLLKLWNTLGETFGIESIGLNWSCLWPFHFSNNLLASMLSCSMLLSFSKQLGLGIMLHSYPHSSPVESIVLLHWSPSMVLIDGVEDFFS